MIGVYFFKMLQTIGFINKTQKQLFCDMKESNLKREAKKLSFQF